MKTMLLVVLLLTQSCATLFSSSDDTISIKTKPSGAEVFLNEERVGVTPIELEIERDSFQQARVRIVKDGYDSKNLKIGKTLNKVALFNLSSLLSWGTDALTGKMIEYSPKKYYVELSKSGVSLNHNREEEFVIMNRDRLLEDLVNGEGEYLLSYCELSGKNPKKLVENIRPYLESLINTSDSVDFYKKLKSIQNI